MLARGCDGRFRPTNVKAGLGQTTFPPTQSFDVVMIGREAKTPIDRGLRFFEGVPANGINSAGQMASPPAQSFDAVLVGLTPVLLAVEEDNSSFNAARGDVMPCFFPGDR